MGEEGCPRLGWGLKEPDHLLHLPREAQGWRLTVAQWSGAPLPEAFAQACVSPTPGS